MRERRVIRSAALAGLLLVAAGGPPAAAEWAVPVETARPCPGHGPGFVQLPGTTTCVRVGGRITSEYGASTARAGGERVRGFGNAARVAVDARSETPYGTARTYLRVRAGQGLLAPDRRGPTAFITVPTPGDH